jgi:adenine-specific DNA-methyltransferase
MYALLGSTLYDQYYRILNGSTQVNSTEVNTIPVPDRPTIEAMGKELMTMVINEDSCNKIVNKWIS